MRCSSFFTLFFLAACFLIVPQTAQADIINTFAKVDCSTDLNYLRIDVFGVNGALSRKMAEQNGATIQEKENIVFYDNLVEVDKDFYQREKNKFTTTCTLQEEVERKYDEDSIYRTVTYTIIIAPYFFNSNRGGQCGAAESFSVTIKDQDRVLVDDVPFWFNCNKMVSSDIEDQTINTLLFLPHEGYMSFRGRYGHNKVESLSCKFVPRFATRAAWINAMALQRFNRLWMNVSRRIASCADSFDCAVAKLIEQSLRYDRAA